MLEASSRPIVTMGSTRRNTFPASRTPRNTSSLPGAMPRRVRAATLMCDATTFLFRIWNLEPEGIANRSGQRSANAPRTVLVSSRYKLRECGQKLKTEGFGDTAGIAVPKAQNVAYRHRWRAVGESSPNDYFEVLLLLSSTVYSRAHEERTSFHDSTSQQTLEDKIET